MQSALESGQKARIVQIDFSADFDRVNHHCILCKHCSVGIGGSVLSILTQFLSNRSQHIMVDGGRNKLISFKSRSAVGQCFLIVVHHGAFFHSGK